MGARKSKPDPTPDPLIEEWRKIPSSKKEEELQFVKDFQPHNKEVKHLRVLLYGLVGAGKSSFINSVDSALQGKITIRLAETDAPAGKSFTIKRDTHKIQKEGRETFYSFVFTDTVGIEKSDQQGVCVEDIKQDMKGNIKDGYKFHPYSAISEDDLYYNKSPTLQDKVHVLVGVIDGSSASILDDDYKKKMRQVRFAARDLGIPHLAVLTKIDLACPALQSDVKNVFRSKYIKETVDKISADLGFQPNDIFPVKNYNTEMETNDVIDTLILSALKRIIESGETFVNKQ